MIQLINNTTGEPSKVHWLGEDGDGNRIAFVPEGYSLAGAAYWYDDSGYAHVTQAFEADGSASDDWERDDTDQP